ncbi:MAG TPA: hypothetical protein VJV79_27205 [Polyangiaceae bacterium]|nr:hypothetical protein [Polyangiaceae bacterium]
MNIAKWSLFLGAMLAMSGCSADMGEAGEVAESGDGEIGSVEQAFTESGCATSFNPNIFLTLIGRSTQRIDDAQPPYGQAGCTHARRIGVVVSGVVNTRLSVNPLVFPTVAECAQTTVRARVYRNGVLQSSMTSTGVVTNGVCQRPSVGNIFRMGDGADWRVMVQAKVGGTANSGGTLKAVRTILTNQQS